MKLSACRELKANILGRSYKALPQKQTVKMYRMSRAASSAPTAQVERREPTPVAAVGIAPSPGSSKDYKLALRVFKGHESSVSQLTRGLTRHMSEIDLATGVQYRPRLTVRAGGSVGHFRITAGTLGGFVEDANNYYMLSNNHVFANSNCCLNGDPIVQPGPADITGSFKTIGRLDRWHPLSRTNLAGVDAAIATFTDEVKFFEPWNYAGIGNIGVSPVADRFSVTRVVKRGRTTGVRRGTVSAFELDGVAIDYSQAEDGSAVVTFDGQIEIIGTPPTTPFSQPGDSGSFVIDEDTMQAYALLYGGGEDDNGIDRTLAHFMPDVLSALNVQLVQ
jgi:hypothetical protein